ALDGERHVEPPRQLAAEVGGGPAHRAGLGVGDRLHRVAGDEGRPQRAGGHELIGVRPGRQQDCHHHPSKKFHYRSHASRWRASAAPFTSAASLASAMSRRIGAMPQLVPATMRSFGTYLSASPRVAATSSGVSMASLATSIAPTSTSLPASSPNKLNGTRELRHSTET